MAKNFIPEWKWRSLLYDLTKPEELAKHLTEKRSIYAGFDPTSDSLHVGSLLPLLALRRLQNAGHRPILLIGGGTGLIGDPSGKTDERSLNPPEIVSQWVASLKKQAEKFLDFTGNNAAIAADNYEWLGNLKLIPFLRDIGKHFSVNSMLAKESVKSRIQREGFGISYTEFSYMLLQAFDFLELFRRYGCSVQIGGSDQWGNITAGIDLIRRIEGKSAYGITLPLVTKADGTKFGKTESGAIWLDPKKTTPYQFYQFWLNTSDADTPKFLRYFTFLESDEIKQLEKSLTEHPERREAQRILAREVTQLVHGSKALREAEIITEAFFKSKLHNLTPELLEQAFRGLPQSEITSQEIQLTQLLVDVGAAPSKGQARRLIIDGAIQLNGERQTDPKMTLSPDNSLYKKYLIVKKGKKHYFLAKWEK